MEIDVDWLVVGTCLVGTCVFRFLESRSSQLLAHIKNANRVSEIDGLENGQIIGIDLGSVENKSNNVLKSSNNISLVALSKTQKEHKIVFDPHVRLWLTRPNVLSSYFSSVPFHVRAYLSTSKAIKLTINSQDELVFRKVLSPVYSNMDRAAQKSMSANVLDYLSGEKTKAFETIEQGLLVGSRLTAVGYVQHNANSNSGRFWSSEEWSLGGDPNGKGYSLILSTSSLSELVARQGTKTRIFWTIRVIFTSVLLFYLGKKIYAYAQDYLSKYRFNQELEGLRRNARAANADRQQQNGATINNQSDANEDNLCVICLGNARQTFFLPCGHVCLCTDCAEMISNGPQANKRCPICRQAFSAVRVLRYP